MANENIIVGDTFKSRVSIPTLLGHLHGCCFFCCELGAGLFMLSQYFGFKLGMLVGLVFAGVGKPYFHLAHIGVLPGMACDAEAGSVLD